MIGDSLSIFKTTQILDNSITEHHSSIDATLKQTKGKYSTIFHEDYLIRRAPIKNFFSNFVFGSLFVQTMMIRILPNFSQYWGQSKSTYKAIRFFGYIFLVLSPPKHTPIFKIVFISLVFLFLLMILLYFASNFYYKKYRRINLGLCYVARYYKIIMSTIFLPISFCFCGEYLSDVFFHSNVILNTMKGQITSLFVIVFLIIVFIFLFDTLLFKHYDVSFQNILFKVWDPWSLIRIYSLMGINVFICHILPKDTSSNLLILIPAVSFALSLIIFILESFQINWIKNSQHIKILTALFSNIITSLAILFDICFSKNEIYHPKIILWISNISIIVGFYITSRINRLSINISLKRLNSPYYPYLPPNEINPKKLEPSTPKRPNFNQNLNPNKLESRPLEKVNSSYLFKFRRFPSDDSLSSSDDESDIHKSKSNEPRTLSPIFKEASKNPFYFDKHSDDPKERLIASNNQHNLNRYVNIDNEYEESSNKNNTTSDIDLSDFEDDNVNIENYKSLKSIRFASTVFKDLCVGFMYGNEDVIQLNHIDRILEKFPNDTNIFFFLARHRFVFNTKSCVSIEEIMDQLSPHSLFNPIQSKMYQSITRNLEPISINSLNIMETSIHSMDSSFLKLIDSIRSVYNLILYELTTSIPKAILVFQHRYDKMIIKLFSFVQKYPCSPDSLFYVKLFDTFFPNAPEKKELMFWLNYKPNYSVNDISFFPSHASLMINNPECFICNNQTNRESHNQNHDKSKTRVLPDFFESFQSSNRLHFKNVKGPYKFAFKNAFLKLILLISVIIPIITMTLIIFSDNKYLSRSNHIIEGYSYLWRIDLMNNCLYPALFFKNSTNFWDGDFNESYNYSNEDEIFHPLIGTMDEYMLNKLQIISSLQYDLLRFSKGFALNLDAQVFDELNKLFQCRSNLFNNKTIYEMIMFTTFVAEDFLTEDNLYFKNDPDITYGMKILENVWDNSSFINTKLYDKLKLIRKSRESIFPIDQINGRITNYFLIPQLFFLIGSYVFLSFILKTAISKFDMFYFSLRETSKPAVTKMHNICQRYSQFIGHKQLRSQQKPAIHPYKYNIHFLLPTFLIYFLMLVAIGLFVLMSDCYERQTKDIIDTYEKLTIAYHNFTSLIINIIKLQYYTEKLDNNEIELIINEIGQINFYYQGLNWFLESEFPFYCTLCSLVDIMMVTSNKTQNTYYSSLFEWLGMSQFYVNNALYREDVARRLIFHFFGDVDNVFLDVFNYTKEKISSTVVLTGNTMLFLLLFYIFLAFLLLIVILMNIKKADLPFISIINILGRLPENALSKDTFKILGHHKLDHKSHQYYFDPSYYEQVLKTFPHPVIVIDRLMHVDYYNTSASQLIQIPGDEGKFQKGIYKLFEVMAIDLYSFSEDMIDPTDDNNNDNENIKNNDNKNNNTIKSNKSNDNGNNNNDGNLPFCDIVEDYLFDESCSVLYKKLWTQKSQHKAFYSLTIQPIDDGGSGDFNGFNYFNQKNDFRHFALIFKDIGEEIRQQKMLTEEVLKQNQIINQILPKEIANQLMLEQSPIAMAVPNVAISFCDIVSFTPWCGSQTPEVVVTTLNQMFKIFDQMCAKYDQVTKIKCIGDCYMSAAGIFSSNRINMNQNILSQNSRMINVSGSTHTYSYNTINPNNSNASLKTNINITRFIKKKKKSSKKSKKRNSLLSNINQSNSNTEIQLENDNETEYSANLSASLNENSNNEVIIDNFSGDENNSNNNSSSEKQEKINSLNYNKNKIPLIPNKVTRLPQLINLHVNPHQRSHSKPAIRPSLFFNKDENDNHHHHEFSEEQKDQFSSICSDNPFSTASNFEGETENENDSIFTDDIDESKITYNSNTNSNTNSNNNSNNNSDYNNNDEFENENENENENDDINDNIHHSTAHLTPNEISAAHQMLSFCLDLIDAIGIVNSQLGTQLQVRVGASFGGPISAGVIGMRMPMFDIWGEIVNEANAMESGGKAMTVHIKKNYYEIVKDEKYVFNPYVNEKGETTYLVTRS